MVHKELMSKRQLKEYEKLEEKVKYLNEFFEVGESVLVRKDDDSLQEDTITNEFSIVSGGVVAWLKINRCYLAERVNKK